MNASNQPLELESVIYSHMTKDLRPHSPDWSANQRHQSSSASPFSLAADYVRESKWGESWWTHLISLLLLSMGKCGSFSIKLSNCSIISSNWLSWPNHHSFRLWASRRLNQTPIYPTLVPPSSSAFTLFRLLWSYFGPKCHDYSMVHWHKMIQNLVLHKNNTPILSNQIHWKSWLIYNLRKFPKRNFSTRKSLAGKKFILCPIFSRDFGLFQFSDSHLNLRGVSVWGVATTMQGEWATCCTLKAREIFELNFTGLNELSLLLNKNINPIK